MSDINLTRKQTKWLDSRGGRNISDVELDEKGPFILMGSGDGKDIKIHLPK